MTTFFSVSQALDAQVEKAPKALIVTSQNSLLVFPRYLESFVEWPSRSNSLRTVRVLSLGLSH